VPSVTKNQASEHVWALRPAAMVVALLTIVVVALLAATPAWASSVSDVSVELEQNRAGQQSYYDVSFTPPRWLGGNNDSITIDAPAGTVFWNGIGHSNQYVIHDAQAVHLIGASHVELSNDGSTVTLNLSGVNLYAPPGTRVTISLPLVINPPAGTYTLLVRTTTDNAFAESNPYTILPALVGGPPPVPEGPTSKEQCKKGGYEEFGFKNQGQCVAFVERGPKNQGGEASS
jgi:hypothetical protein